MTFFVHESSCIDDGVTIGGGTKIWHFSHVQEGAVIGEDCTLGQNVYVGKDVKIGCGCKIQNNVSIYDGVTLEDYVFCGPSCVFTNDLTPRSEFPKGFANHVKTLVKRGASIGANATIVCGVTIGEYAMIGAGAVVTRDVPAYTLVIGTQQKIYKPIDKYGHSPERRRIDFRDLKAQYQALRPEIDAAVGRVLSEAHFIQGKQVSELEEQLADYVGVKHCISCANGTDALTLALMSYGIGAGDAVFVPDFTYIATAGCASILGATPVFVDIDPQTFNIDADALERAVAQTLQETELTPKAVIPVDLFGLPANHAEVGRVARKYHLLVVEDGAQGFGGTIGGKRACSFGDIAATSFFPAKPLGCYGDGGAIFTNDGEIAAKLNSLKRQGASPADKYDNREVGINSRLDTIQAAILQVKLKAFIEHELAAVNWVAEQYSEYLGGCNEIILPAVPDTYGSAWAQYTIMLPDSKKRFEVQQTLKESGIPSMIYYPRGLHQQTVFSGSVSGSFPNAAKAAECVLSLPMHPYMENADVRFVAESVLRCF